MRWTLTTDRVRKRRIMQLVADAVERRRRHCGHQRGQVVMSIGDGDALVLKSKDRNLHALIRRHDHRFAAVPAATLSRRASGRSGAIDSFALMACQAIEPHEQIAPTSLWRKLSFARP